MLTEYNNINLKINKIEHNRGVILNDSIIFLTVFENKKSNITAVDYLRVGDSLLLRDKLNLTIIKTDGDSLNFTQWSEKNPN